MNLFKKKEKIEQKILDELITNTLWEDLVKTKQLSEQFLDKFIDNVAPYNIALHQKLSEDFIREHYDKLDMVTVAQHQDLSTDFIREFSFNKDFLKAAMNIQHMDINFVREHEETYRELLHNSNYIQGHAFNRVDYYKEFKDDLKWWDLNKKDTALTKEFIDRFIEKFNFSSEDRKILKVDEEHYKAIREGAKPLTKLHNSVMIDSGHGIEIVSNNVYYDQNWVYDRIDEVVTCSRCDSQCDHCKYKEEYENSDWQLDN